jgi:hypothetical protein
MDEPNKDTDPFACYEWKVGQLESAYTYFAVTLEEA